MNTPSVSNCPSIVNWRVADAAALAALSLTLADIGKVALQLDTGQFYILKRHSPATWAELTTSTQLATPTFTGNITLGNGLQIVALTTAITANVTATTAPAGSIGVTSHATGVGKLFMSDGSKWQFAVVA